MNFQTDQKMQNSNTNTNTNTSADAIKKLKEKVEFIPPPPHQMQNSNTSTNTSEANTSDDTDADAEAIKKLNEKVESLQAENLRLKIAKQDVANELRDEKERKEVFRAKTLQLEWEIHLQGLKEQIRETESIVRDIEENPYLQVDMARMVGFVASIRGLKGGLSELADENRDNRKWLDEQIDSIDSSDDATLEGSYVESL